MAGNEKYFVVFLEFIFVRVKK